MKLPQHINNLGFVLADTNPDDVNDYVRVNKLCYKRYIDEYSDFFGSWNDEVAVDEFNNKMKLTYFAKLIQNAEVVGFLNYDIKEDSIDNISMIITENAQNNGIGSSFLSFLVDKSTDLGIQVYLEVIKSNPAQDLYKRFGFKDYSEKDVFYQLRYTPYINQCGSLE